MSIARHSFVRFIYQIQKFSFSKVRKGCRGYTQSGQESTKSVTDYDLSGVWLALAVVEGQIRYHLRTRNRSFDELHPSSIFQQELRPGLSS